ncbi:head to tail joining protein [Caudoviricetes sp.]|nr:head to tail joining protein [Caudoviricetes sp.]
MAEIKNRRINKNDIKKVEEFITAELDSRKNAQFRKDAEEKWREIDRQLAMKPMDRVDSTGKKLPKSWHNVFELGELSKASEIITADTMRIAFPSDRKYFEAHVEVPLGQQKPEEAESGQRRADGVLRSLMIQQQMDFGFRPRVELSVKEALHHGSFVAVVKWHQEKMVRQGDKVKFLGAPVWTPYSMWNSYPDPSPAVIPSGIFYQGSMIVVEYMPLWRLKKQTGNGWMPSQYSQIKSDEKETKDGNRTKDVELAHYYGDLFIDRKNEESGIYLPNCHAITANGILVFYEAIDLPFSPVIYDGYERQDIRDPYYVSPLVKQSPIQKIATICANKYLDALALAVEPPGEYDANDPDYVANGGPIIAPGAQTPTRSMGKGWNTLKVGDPNFALGGLQMCLRQLQEGTGVSAVRSGIANSDRQTATEVQKVAQGAEVRTVDFVSKLERSVKNFLYMSHEYNRMYLDDYPFYNDEMNTPDFMRASKDDIDYPSHFDVVGSKGLLGEEQRTQRITQATMLFSGNPLFAPKLRVQDIMLEVYRDAGKKNPEEFVQIEESGKQVPPEIQQKMQQAQAIIQELSKKLQQSEAKTQVEMAKLQQKAQEAAAKDKLERDKMAAEYKTEMLRLAEETKLAYAQIQSDNNQKMMQMSADLKMAHKELGMNLLTHISGLRHEAGLKQLEMKYNTESEDGAPEEDAKPETKLEDVLAMMAGAIDQGNKTQQEILKTVSKPKTVKVERTATGLVGTVNTQ